ncbi:uncharacterized protein LOC127871522 isoform X2 [Dreissena polymorpha]|uniref:uncharacterized protein LOC127871522 isoform X2 n=1 Tax=Dreissena polymorpha TaxID=45954 RepID=UPI002263FD19|nr:uncharacterized protein LOC127871522 isoform X2 [Dreissena polymorpha]
MMTSASSTHASSNPSINLSLTSTSPFMYIGNTTTPLVSAPSVITFQTPSMTSYVTDEQTTIENTNPPFTQYPVLRPDLGFAVYVVEFVLVINAKYDPLIEKDESFLEDLRTKLNTNMFNNTPGYSFTLSFSEGSIKCHIEARFNQSAVMIANKNITTVLQQIDDNVRSIRNISTTRGEVKTLDLQQNVKDIRARVMALKDQCSLITGACRPDYELTCLNGDVSRGSCVHKCVTTQSIDYCGNHGTCFYDFGNDVLACKCDQTSYHVYHGSRCDEMTATQKYVLTMSLGIGGGVVFVLLIIIICVCIRNYRNKNKHNIRWDEPPTGRIATLKDLSFRSHPGKTGSTYGRYHRTPGHVNMAFEPVFSGSGRLRQGMYLPSPDEDDFYNTPSFMRIDPAADYSIQRPQVSTRPSEIYRQLYSDTHSEFPKDRSRQMSKGPQPSSGIEIRTML